MRDDPSAPPPFGHPENAHDPYGVRDAHGWMPESALDPRERRMRERMRRRARITQAAVAFWIFASTFVIVPLIFRHPPLWIIAIATGVIAAVIGFFLPTNVPEPRPPSWDPDQPYGVYDPRGPHRPRS